MAVERERRRGSHISPGEMGENRSRTERVGGENKPSRAWAQSWRGSHNRLLLKYRERQRREEPRFWGERHKKTEPPLKRKRQSNLGKRDSVQTNKKGEVTMKSFRGKSSRKKIWTICVGITFGTCGFVGTDLAKDTGKWFISVGITEDVIKKKKWEEGRRIGEE